MEKIDAETSVKVAIRIRPQNAREQVDMCRVCTFVTPGEPQVILGKDKAFTYDYVYDVGTEQLELYSSCVESLVEGCFSGLNATVLAYGQTGSGKTYTMGTGFDVTVLPEEQGAIPRAVHHLFNGIDARQKEAQTSNIPAPQFQLSTQFLELYNEEIIDLFDSSRDSSKRLRIHESQDGNIYVDGAITHQVKSEEETLEVLKRGALSRSVGSTNMNAQSSRSHAIFTLIMVQQRPIVQVNSDSGPEVLDWETLTSKFHFVDLAGSERLKRTGATGERAKEGISINCGLLALGNVISALGDKAKKGSHVPYRDSKLTRLLQDSLGGNSQTLMIACISPSDRDFMETLNTLKYANRARNIKNKVTVNQDKSSAQISALHKRIQELELEIQEFRAGRLVVTDDGSVVLNDLSSENTLLKAENDKLRIRIKAMQSLIDSQNERLATLQSEKDLVALRHQDQSTGQVMSVEGAEDGSPHIQGVLQEYLQQIEDLRSQLLLSESQREQIQHSSLPQHHLHRLTSTSSTIFTHTPPNSAARQRGGPGNILPEIETTEMIQTARNHIERLQEEMKIKSSGSKDASAAKTIRWRRRRTRKRDRSISPERMSTDVEAWVLKSQSETDIFASATDEEDDEKEEGEAGSDTEVNEDEENTEDEEISDLEAINLSCSSESEDDAEAMDDTASITTSIAELTTEINIKQQLVDQLEKAQKSLHSLRSQYEEKMAILQQQIRATESERDKMIKEISNSRHSERWEDQIKELREHYEKQLNSLKQELKQLQVAKREHAKAVKKNIQQDSELRKLKSDLTDMKKQKVNLLKQLKEETSVYKMKEQKREREIAQLRKDHRKKENLIKTLQADARRKEMVLKRKQEEVVALRRQQSNSSKNTAQTKRERPMTAPPISPSITQKSNGPAAKKARLQRRQSSVYTSDSAKRKWRDMERLINEIVNRRQTMNCFESDLDRWIQKREELSHKADELKLQREDLLQASEEYDMLDSIEEELEAQLAQISWANDCIEKLQEDIVIFEDTKMESDTVNAIALIHTCSTREAKYLLEHIVNMAIESGTLASQKDIEVKSLKMRLATSEQHAELIKMYSSPHVPQSPLVINSRTVSKITTTLHPMTLPPPLCINLDSPSHFDDKRANEAILLSGDDCIEEQVLTDTVKPIQVRILDVEDQDELHDKEHTPEEMEHCNVKYRRRTALPTEIRVSLGHRRQLSDPPSPKFLHQSSNEDKRFADNVDGSKGLDLATSLHVRTRKNSGDLSSPKRPTQPFLSKKRSAPLLPQVNNDNSSGERGFHASVTRLSSVQETGTTYETRGYFETERSLSTRSGKFLMCTHTVKGHSSGVLTVYATDLILFSGSQDCTVKVWDLSSGQEMATLTRHHSYVRKVTYCPTSQLVFTACQSLIKIWDLRDLRNPQFIKTLLPPGQTTTGSNPPLSSLTSADTVVQDIVINGDMLFSAAGNAVNVWDLRQMSAIGRLVGHNGAVGTMATLNDGILATGSRDRLIKLYEVSRLLYSEQGFNQLPQSTLSPAHYDTVSSLAVHQNIMYSACGVSIKKWDVDKRSLVQAVDGAHPQSRGNTITSLDVLNPSLLVSACKSGTLKMWLTDNCHNIGEISAHKMSINSIAVNQYSVFTASSDKTVKIWRPNTSLFLQNS